MCSQDLSADHAAQLGLLEWLIAGLCIKLASFGADYSVNSVRFCPVVLFYILYLVIYILCNCILSNLYCLVSSCLKVNSCSSCVFFVCYASGLSAGSLFVLCGVQSLSLGPKVLHLRSVVVRDYLGMLSGTVVSGLV